MQIETSDRFISIKEVCAELGVGKSTIYLWVQTGQFPQSHSLGLRCSRWLESEVLPRGLEIPRRGLIRGGGGLTPALMVIVTVNIC